ncbi:MAG: PQQ-binding-like beta-propeller repeat protein [Thermoguttaceae bacterium]|jgi:outer membrane protein assembly factor BamB
MPQRSSRFGIHNPPPPGIWICLALCWLAPAKDARADAWPMFRGDRLASGVSKGTLPEQLELLWTFSSPQGGFESTAAIVDGVVYAGSTDGKLYAIDLRSGKQRWEFVTELGFNASPTVSGPSVFIGDVDGRFYSINARTGKANWTFSTDGEIDSSANLYKDCVLFGSQDSFLYCLKADTGKLAWKYQSTNQIRCFPTIIAGRAMIAGCDGSLHAIDLEHGASVAEVPIESPTGCTAAAAGETVFVGTEGNVFFAIDVQRAKILWRYESRERSQPFRSSAAVAEGVVLVGSRDHLLHALAADDGRPLWSFTSRGYVDSSPVVVQDRVFVGSADGRLYGLDLKTGREVWRFEAGGAVSASPAVAAGRLVIGTNAGNLYCFGEPVAIEKPASGVPIDGLVAGVIALVALRALIALCRSHSNASGTRKPS